jgi:hypothetical protein
MKKKKNVGDEPDQCCWVRLGALFKSENFERVLNLLIKIIKWAVTAMQGKIGEIHSGPSRTSS